MDRAELAVQLSTADPTSHHALLERYAGQADAALAEALRQHYANTYSSAPAQAAGAAAALSALAQLAPQPQITALADWVGGMAALQLAGQHERAIQLIDQAAAQFEALGAAHTAAETQVSKIYALAMLGRYTEAIGCGLRTRAVFEAAGDDLSAGKIELNLGNIHRRRDEYAQAEQLYRAARARFTAIGDQRLLAYAENDLANVLNMQHNFRAAEQLYEQALARTEASGLEVTRAEIECNLGCLELFQGHYDRALTFLEQSRRRYTGLGMPHELAIAELELADAFLELNLAPEAAMIYGRITTSFAELGMRAEQARALLNHSRACLMLGQAEQARALLATTQQLYAAEGNRVGVALVTLTQAQIAAAEGDYAAVIAHTSAAEPPIAEAGMWGRLLFTRWLHGDAQRLRGEHAAARATLAATLAAAEQRKAPHIAQRCHTSLGLLSSAQGDHAAAEAAFSQAVALTEALRMPLPADEFRTAFVADKLTPYTELVRICLADQRPARIAEALEYAERARSRALLDMLGDSIRLAVHPRDAFEADLLQQLDDLRAELNWFYSQINRPTEAESARGAAELEAMYVAARAREAQIAELDRQLRLRGHRTLPEGDGFDLAQLQRELGDDSALLAYFDLDGALLAFLVTNTHVEVVRGLGQLAQAEAAIGQLQFQIGTLRYGLRQLKPHLAQLTERCNYYLGLLYDQLLRPIESRLGDRRLVVVPHHVLHYVPFHALYDGSSHVIERREVCYAPSASVLLHCQARPQRPLERAVILGVQDARTPHIHREVAAVAAQFPAPTILLDTQARVAALQAAAPHADVLHLACHGHFRPDNPLFSAIELADGQLTVRDAYRLALECQLVTLSACETGVNEVAPGNELIGLARGFISAGAPALMMSLWAVDDHSTADLMEHFYQQLRAGMRPAAALRQAQLGMRAARPHPCYWAPFILLGRW